MLKNLSAYSRQVRWIIFALAVPISFYVSYFGTIFMGFCPGLECWPHNFAWILLTPCLLLAIWSLRAKQQSLRFYFSSRTYTQMFMSIWEG